SLHRNVASRSTRLLRSLFVERYLGAILQFATDRAVTSRDYFVTGLNAAFDFGVSVVGNSSRHFRQLRLVRFFEEHDLGYFFALFFLCRFLSALIDELRIVIALVTLRDLLLFLFDFFRTQIALTSATGHGLHRHVHDVLHFVRVRFRSTSERGF